MRTYKASNWLAGFLTVALAPGCSFCQSQEGGALAQLVQASVDMRHAVDAGGPPSTRLPKPGRTAVNPNHTKQFKKTAPRGPGKTQVSPSEVRPSPHRRFRRRPGRAHPANRMRGVQGYQERV